MKLGSLFSGAGLGDLGWMMAGFEISWQVEIDDYCQKILELRFPETEKYRDIKKFKGKEAGAVDIVAGGVPCQPASVAGNQRGSEDDRWLWPEAIRVIKEIKPRWVVWENVFGLLSLKRGMEFENICSEMESCGYEVQTFSFTAHSLGASHRRERIWIVGYTNNPRNGTSRSKVDEIRQTKNEGQGDQPQLGSCGSSENASNTTDAGIEGMRERKKSTGKRRDDRGDNRKERQALHDKIRDAKKDKSKGIGRKCGVGEASSDVADTGQQYGEGNSKGVEANKTKWSDSIIHAESGSQRQPSSNTNTKRLEGCEEAGNIKKGRSQQNEQFAGCDSIRNYWSTEPRICRVVNGCPSRVDRLKALGNGQVVVATAFIGQQIMEFEKLNNG